MLKVHSPNPTSDTLRSVPVILLNSNFELQIARFSASDKASLMGVAFLLYSSSDNTGWAPITGMLWSSSTQDLHPENSGVRGTDVSFSNLNNLSKARVRG